MRTITVAVLLKLDGSVGVNIDGLEDGQPVLVTVDQQTVRTGEDPAEEWVRLGAVEPATTWSAE